MPKVGQQGCPAAPHASHVLETQMLLVAVHAEPEPMHWFDVGSQHRVDVHAGPEVQHGSCSYPHVCICVVDVVPEQLWYAAICGAQWASMAVWVAVPSSLPSVAHCCWA